MVHDKTFYEIRYMKQLQSFDRIFHGILTYKTFVKFYKISADTLRMIERQQILNRKHIGHISLICNKNNKRYLSNYKILKNEYLAQYLIDNNNIYKYIYDKNKNNDYIIIPSTKNFFNTGYNDYIKHYAQRGFYYVCEGNYKSKTVHCFCVANVRKYDYNYLLKLISKFFELYYQQQVVGDNDILQIDIINDSDVNFDRDKLLRKALSDTTLMSLLRNQSLSINAKNYNIFAKNYILL